MTDVFVSYGRSSESQATKIADALRRQGYEVWRDDEIPANRAYSEVIEERLLTAKAVVVVWSADAARSHWVRAEADRAREAWHFDPGDRRRHAAAAPFQPDSVL